MMKAKRVYLAGPDVFLPQPTAIADQKKTLCQKHGFEGVFPLDAELDLISLSQPEQGLRISQANEELIRGCDLVIAHLTPFRGPSADVGTVYELGLARGLGLPIFGYSNTTELFAMRTLEFLGDEVALAEAGEPRDEFGMQIEDFLLHDNLMIEGGIVGSGGQYIVRETSQKSRYTDLAAFEECLKAAVSHFDQQPQ